MMKTIIYLNSLWLVVAVGLVLTTGARAQNPAMGIIDPVLGQSAQAAVQKMGVEMMKGNFKYGHEHMYPRWKRRLAKRYGGMERLEKGLEASAQKQVQLGMRVIGYQAGVPTSAFTVWRAKKRDPKTGEIVLDATGRETIVDHWLVVVPTTTRVSIPDKQVPGKNYVLEEKSYTLAISEKGSQEWHFLTGMKPTIQDLRSLFPSLPPKEEDLGLPAPSAVEIK